MKMLLRILTLAVVLIAVTAAGALVFIFDTEGGLHWVTAQLVDKIPGKLTYDSLNGRLAEKITLQNLHYEQDNAEYNIEKLVIHLQLKDLLRGSLHIISIEGDGIEYIQRRVPSITQQINPPAQTFANDISQLPFSIKLDKGALRRISILVEDTQAKDTQKPIFINEVTADSISLNKSLMVNKIQVATTDNSIVISGSVEITQDFPLDLQTSWRATIPGYTTVSGSGTLKGNIQRLEISQSVEKPFKAQVHGNVNNPFESSQQEMKLSAAWQTLSWPAGPSPTITSRQGTIQIEGNLDDYQFSISTSLEDTQQFPPGKWIISGQGGLNKIVFHRIDGEILDGRLHGEGRLNWQPQLAWKFELHGNDINPAQKWPEWPGLISFSAVIDGGLRDKGLFTSVDLQNASGKIRNFPMAAQGKLEWTPTGIDVSNVKINSGNNTIIADGSLTDRWDLDWDINASEIQTLLPHVSGTILGKGKVIGPKNTPHLTLAAQGRQLAYEENATASLDVSADIDMLSTQPSIINLEARDIRLGRQNLDTFELQSIGLINNHNLHMILTSDHTTANISIHAAFKNKQWTGEISTAEVKSPKFGSWTLDKPVDYIVDPTTIRISNACWRNLPAQLCTAIHWQQDMGGEATLSADALPLGFLNGMLPSALEIDGLLTAQGKFNISARNDVLGSLQLSTRNGHLSNTLTNGTEITAEYSEASARIVLDNDHISADASLNINKGNTVTASISLPQTPLNISAGTSFDNVPVVGELKVELNDLELIPYFIPDVENTTGTINIKLALNGTTSQPQLKVITKLENGSAEIPRLGLNLAKIQISVTGNSIDNLKITSSVESGKGTLAVNGTFGWDKDNLLRAHLSSAGKRFEVVNIPEYWILASPEMTVDIAHRRIDINGTIDIPEARIDQPDFTTTRTTSSDVIIETGEKQDEGQRWKIYSLVNIIMGQKVKFDGYGLTGNIDGNVAIIDAPGQITTAYGQLQIYTGVYILQFDKSILKAYKLKLNVDKGRLLFVGGPLDNPGLDINATKKIDEVTASVDVRGTLQHPQPPHVSCNPAMSDTDCISYLLLGFPMSQASQSEGTALYGAATSIAMAGGDFVAKQIGSAFQIDDVHIESGSKPEEATLMVGKHLSSKLYVGYGIGLIEPINTFIMRYKLGSKWSLQTESGYNSGADIFYTLEK